MGREFKVVGTRPARVDGPDKVTGRAKYAGDIFLPGMLFGRVLRSTMPHARIKSINTEAALALPGVVAIVTGADLSILADPRYGHAIKDRPVLALGEVRFVGEPVAVVAAVDDLTAEDALELIEVEYEELPVAADLDSALAEGAALVHQGEGGEGDFGALAGEVGGEAPNVCYHRREEHGDIEAAFAGAAHVFKHYFTFPAVYHYAMEPFTTVAEWRDDGTLHLYSSCQHPFVVRSELAGLFGLPFSSVRVVVPFLGGGFGSKSYTNLEPLVALVAKKAGRPVRVAISIEESFYTKRRHAARIWLETATEADGRIRGRRARIHLDTGAYADNGPRVADRAAQRLLNAYITPAFQVDAYAVYTHTAPAGSYRAIGAPQALWASESQMDIIAHELSIDPVEIRIRNLAPKGGQPLPKRKPLDGDLIADIKTLAAAMPLGKRERSGHTAVGRGMAVGTSGAGAGPVSTALVRLHADGSVSLLAGTTEIGQGARTVLSMVCAEALGVPLERVRFVPTDTDYTPFDRSTGASRSTTVMGTAILSAATDLREQILNIAAEMAECAPVDLRVEDGEVIRPDGKRIAFHEVVKFFYGMRGGELMGRGYSGPRVQGTKVSQNPVFWEVGMGAAEVAVDMETGEVRVTSYTSLADVGRVIHPALAEGQETGAFAQGLGHTLFEEMHYENGLLLNPNLVDYRVPMTVDMPRFHSILVENGDGPGPYGAKGMGEGALMPVAPAVANAIFQATGVRITDLPLTPERVWRALQEGQKHGG